MARFPSVLDERDQPDAQPSAARIGIFGWIHTAQSRIAELDGRVEQGEIHAAHNHERNREERKDHKVERLMALILAHKNRDLMLPKGNQGTEAKHQRHRYCPETSEGSHERAMVGDMDMLGAVTKQHPAQ
jgi:hypothetical protein